MKKIFLLIFIFTISFFSFGIDIKKEYLDLNLPKSEISYELFEKAYVGYLQIPNKNPDKLVIIDYTKPSSEKRFYVIDFLQKKLIFSSRVAHSKNSGVEVPIIFSDEPNSYRSSLGFFITLDKYDGKYGVSLRLRGLEKNINSNAERRAIVLHGGEIVEDEYIEKYGFAGRSLGCPVLPRKEIENVIELIKDGTVIFVYGDDEEYLKNSIFLKNFFQN